MNGRAATSIAVALLVIGLVGAAIMFEPRPATFGNEKTSGTALVSTASVSPPGPGAAPASTQEAGSPSSQAPAPQAFGQSENGGCTPTRTGSIVVRGSLKGFVPAALNLTVGQTVTFTMGPMAFSCSFNEAGSFTYHCADHPFMTVAVTVRE